MVANIAWNHRELSRVIYYSQSFVISSCQGDSVGGELRV